MAGIGGLRNSAARWLALDLSQLGRDDRRRAIIGGSVVLFVAIAVSMLNYFLRGPNHDQYDLRIYYSAVTFWLDGNSLYDYAQPDPVNVSLGFTYPPIAAILMAPMAWIPVGVVVVLHFVMLIACSALLTWLYLRQYWPLRPFQLFIVTGVVCALGFLLQPIAQNIGFGQVNLLLAALVVVDVLVLGGRGSRWFGVGIGLAMALKLTPGIFLLLLVLDRRWRGLLTAIGSAAAVIAVGFAINWSDSVRYYTALIWESDRVGFLDNPVNQSWNGTLARLTAPEQPSRALWLLGALLLVALGAVRIRRALRADDLVAALTLTGFVGALVSPVTWVHHIVWLMPAAIVLYRWFWVPAADGRRRVSRRALLLSATGLFLWVFDIPSTFHLPDTGFENLSLGSALIASQQFIWLVLAVILLPIGATADRAASRSSTTQAIHAAS
ncbi:MAG: glycosyltransferase 87 family protein [Nakamurella sp.]